MSAITLSIVSLCNYTQCHIWLYTPPAKVDPPPPFHPGRPPWYNEEGEHAKAFMIGLAGGSASGKTTVAREVIQSLRVPWVNLLSMDSFYKVLTPEQHQRAANNDYNFDIPGGWVGMVCC